MDTETQNTEGSQRRSDTVQYTCKALFAFTYFIWPHTMFRLASNPCSFFVPPLLVATTSGCRDDSTSPKPSLQKKARCCGIKHMMEVIYKVLKLRNKARHGGGVCLESNTWRGRKKDQELITILGFIVVFRLVWVH